MLHVSEITSSTPAMGKTTVWISSESYHTCRKVWRVTSLDVEATVNRFVGHLIALVNRVSLLRLTVDLFWQPLRLSLPATMSASFRFTASIRGFEQWV